MSLKIEFKTDNAAFDDNPATEASRILHEIAERIERGSKEDSIRDHNGNQIGHYEMEA